MDQNFLEGVEEREAMEREREVRGRGGGTSVMRRLKGVPAEGCEVGSWVIKGALATTREGERLLRRERRGDGATQGAEGLTIRGRGRGVGDEPLVEVDACVEKGTPDATNFEVEATGESSSQITAISLSPTFRLLSLLPISSSSLSLSFPFPFPFVALCNTPSALSSLLTHSPLSLSLLSSPLSRLLLPALGQISSIILAASSSVPCIASTAVFCSCSSETTSGSGRQVLVIRAQRSS